jgi:DNA mismatch endonuclease (patch repair protein)
MPLARPIKTNRSYWAEKLARNLLRDARNRRKLRALGWRALIVRECELPSLSRLQLRLQVFLEDP